MNIFLRYHYFLLIRGCSAGGTVAVFVQAKIPLKHVPLHSHPSLLQTVPMSFVYIPSMSLILNEKSIPTLPLAIRIAKALKMDVEEIWIEKEIE